MKRITTPNPLPMPCEMHSGQLSGTTILCTDGILKVASVGELPWRRVEPGWYSLTPEERDNWAHWACWSPGDFYHGGLEWPKSCLCPVPSFEGIGQRTKGTKMSQVPTTRLNNGMEVLAKQYKGELYAVTYANRTQASRKARELGKGWAVYSWGRPFYVGKED